MVVSYFLIMLAAASTPSGVGGLAYVGAYSTQAACGLALKSHVNQPIAPPFIGFACVPGLQLKPTGIGDGVRKR